MEQRPGYRDTYLSAYPGYYLTADAGFKDEDGYLWIMSRTDDVINVAGHRLSTGAMEEVLAAHPDVAECAVVGVTTRSRAKSRWVLLCSRPELRGNAKSWWRAGGAGATEDRPGGVIQDGNQVKRLPKTRSGKIVRGTIKKIADGVPYTIPPTIDDPAILDEITADLAAIGYPQPARAFAERM